MSNPRHVNPHTNDQWLPSTAEYNFVPLPEKVLLLEHGLPAGETKDNLWETHDRYVPGTHSGWLDIKIWTESPLFIRGPVFEQGKGWSDYEVDGQGQVVRKEARRRPAPSATPDGLAMIPGSSLRGLLRSLYEILTFSKLQPVPEDQLFFRSLAGKDDRIGSFYRKRMELGGGKRAGRFQKTPQGYKIAPCKFVKVKHDIVSRFIYDNTPNATIKWNHHCKSCHFTLDQDGRVNEFHWEKPQAGNFIAGTFIQTGAAGEQKLHEFIFYDEDESAPIPVPDELVERFNDDDQLTKWQCDNFSANMPVKDARRRKGQLAHGDPIFFLADDSLKSEDNPQGLLFFGRAGMFRLPYDKSPFDLLQEDHHSHELDMAEALFGRVRKPRKGVEEPKHYRQVKGRLIIDDALSNAAWKTLTAAGRTAVFKTTLLSPHPTSYQHYLTQNGPAGASSLTTYLDGDKTTLRGAKLFWHKPTPPPINNLQRHNGGAPGPIESLLQPIAVPEKNAFFGRIQFHNLSPAELGALLEAVELPEGHAHKLGMAKGKGLGSVRIKIHHIELLNLQDRYKTYAPTAETPTTTSNPPEADAARAAFLKRISAHAAETQEHIIESNKGLRKIARLDALYLMLTLKHENAPQTKTLDIEEFKKRRVLPTPHGALDPASEPNWPSNPPTAAPPPKPPTTQAQPHAPPQGKPLQQGQTIPGLLFRKEDKNWACIVQDRGTTVQGTVTIPQNLSIPDNTPDNSKAEFYILSYKKGELKARFQKLCEPDAGKV